MVSISERYQSFIGTQFELICTAQLLPENNRGETISIIWFSSILEFANSSDSCITVTETMVLDGQMFESRIIFDPLYEIHDGKIICRADVEVTSKFVFPSETRETYDLDVNTGMA